MDSSSTSTTDSTFGLKLDREMMIDDVDTSKSYNNALGSNCFAEINSVCVQCRENYFLQNGDCYSCPSSADIATTAVFTALSGAVGSYYTSNYVQDYKSLFEVTDPNPPDSTLTFACLDCILGNGDW